MAKIKITVEASRSFIVLFETIDKIHELRDMIPEWYYDDADQIIDEIGKRFAEVAEIVDHDV